MWPGVRSISLRTGRKGFYAGGGGAQELRGKEFRFYMTFFINQQACRNSPCIRYRYFFFRGDSFDEGGVTGRSELDLFRVLALTRDGGKSEP